MLGSALTISIWLKLTRHRLPDSSLYGQTNDIDKSVISGFSQAKILNTIFDLILDTC